MKLLIDALLAFLLMGAAAAVFAWKEFRGAQGRPGTVKAASFDGPNLAALLGLR